MKPFLLKKRAALLACAAALSLTACQKNIATLQPVKDGKATDLITPYSFNWETVDWMPTPNVPGQSQISPPWVGQGSIASLFGADVNNDHRAADGWELIYNTFDPRATGPLVNPYFMLYNRYRGLVRIYYYISTPISDASTYLVDGLTLVSNHTTNMFQFLGTNYVDASQHPSSFTQVESAPMDGSAPLASSKWFMSQYELAYDPNISTTFTDADKLSWFTNYNSVSQISLGGTLTGTIKSPVGAGGSALNTALQNGGTVAGTSALSLLGTAIFNNNGNASTGVNTLGLPNFIFKDLSSALTSALTGGTSKIPAAITGILSALIGGSSATPTVNLEVNCNITLQGTTTSHGSFPSSPSAVYIPGSQINPQAQNYGPLQSHALGLWGMIAKPTVVADLATSPDGSGYYHNSFNLDPNYPIDQLMAFNPQLNDPVNGAAIVNLRAMIILPQFLVHDLPSNIGDFIQTTGQLEQIGNNTAVVQVCDQYGDEVPFYIDYYRQMSFTGPIGVRISFDVYPFNGAPKSTVIKTFDCNVIAP